MSYSIVIPSRSRANFEACLVAIRNEGQERARVLVVDDGLGYTEWPCHTAVERCCTARVLVVDDGLGYTEWPCHTAVERCCTSKAFNFARNVNHGIRCVAPDDVVILNDDALLKSQHGFALLARAAEEHPEYGVIGAVTNLSGNVNQQPKGYGLREDARMVCFVCVYIPRRTIDLVGLLDEAFDGYGYEDDDYCVRVRKAGFKIGIHDGCYVDHGALTSSYRKSPMGQGNPAAVAKARQIFLKKWGRLDI